MSKVHLHRWPVTAYEPALRWQKATAEAVSTGGDEAFALLQHEPVYTFGRQVRREHLLVDESVLGARGAELVETDRGGDITFHGPGQIVGYPILDLRRHNLGAVDYVRRLEETLIRTLAHFGIDAARSPGRPGVWVGDAKIGAIGVRVRRGVTTHGFALNVDVDLAWFDAIVPCGIAGASVTSMTRELGLGTISPPAPYPCEKRGKGVAGQLTQGGLTLEAVTDALVREFESVFGVSLMLADATPTRIRGRS